MKLQVFTKDVQDEWVQQGYDSVKITASGNLSINELEEAPFFLLEPYNNLIDVGGGDLVQNISSPAVSEIIEKENGRYFR